MYGQIHNCVRSLVVEKFGEEAWSKILAKSELDDEHFMTFHHFPDTQTLKLVGAVSEVLGVPVTTVLELFGEYFLTYCMMHGYDKMLLTLGHDFKTFIQNLDSLHALLAMSYRRIKAPSFRCESQADGTLMLHYYSIRPGLHPIVTGLLRAVGQQLFNATVTSELVKTGEEDLDDAGKQYFAIFHVIISGETPSSSRNSLRSPSPDEDVRAGGGREGGDDGSSKGSINRGSPSTVDGIIPSTAVVTPKSFCNIFPFHIIFDSDMRLVQCGSNIARLSGSFAQLCDRTFLVTDLFRMLHPRMPFTFHHIRLFINASYILELRSPNGHKRALSIRRIHHQESTSSVLDADTADTEGNGCGGGSNHHGNHVHPMPVSMSSASLRSRPTDVTLALKGQMIHLEDINHMIFVGSPRLSSLNEMQECNLYLSDIPLYDVTRELVLLNQQRIAELEVSKKLDETTAELKKTSRLLADEKLKTDTLLYQMLPIKVANQLREGKKVEAEKYEQATILFSDIVTFTNIASAVQPMDIVNMLNSLYSRFDNLCTMHGVYKVETIGDAYMVVGGLPEVTPRHASFVANMALDMIVKANEVHSPATGKPLQIRVGLHTGAVVAGVVGDKMPRYCLFGDTVNTASRMESHGVPGRIHCSHTTYGALSGENYIFDDRGVIQVKGKGDMNTYFLVGRDGRVLEAALGLEADEESQGHGATVSVKEETVIIFDKKTLPTDCPIIAPSSNSGYAHPPRHSASVDAGTGIGGFAGKSMKTSESVGPGLQSSFKRDSQQQQSMSRDTSGLSETDGQQTQGKKKKKKSSVCLLA